MVEEMVGTWAPDDFWQVAEPLIPVQAARARVRPGQKRAAQAAVPGAGRPSRSAVPLVPVPSAVVPTPAFRQDPLPPSEPYDVGGVHGDLDAR